MNLEFSVGEVDRMGSIAGLYVWEGLGGNQLGIPSGLATTPVSATEVLLW